MSERSVLVHASILVVVWISPASPLAQTDGGGLTVDRAVERALDHPLRRQIRRAGADEERAAVRAERVWPNPTFGWAREQFWESPPAFAAEDDFTLEQSLPITGRKRLRYERARAQKRAAAAERQGAKVQLEAEVRRAFYAVLAAEARVALWDDQVESMEARVEKVRADTGKGERARVDLLAFEQSLADARIERDAAASSLRSERNRLATLVSGSAEASGSEASPSGELLPSEPPPSLEQLKRRAEERPDLRVLEHRADAASRERSAASRSWMPEPTVTGGYKRIDAEDGGSIHGFIAGLSIPLGFVDTGKWSAREAAARKRRIESRLALRRTRVHRRIESRRRSAVEALERARTYRDEVVSRARKIWETQKSARDAGAASAMEAQEAQVAFFEARRRAAALALRARIERIEVLRTAGFDGPGEKGR